MNFKTHISTFITITVSVISLSSCSIFEPKFGNCARIAELIMKESLQKVRNVGDEYIEHMRVSDMSEGVVYLYTDRTGNMSVEQESKDLMGFSYTDGLIDSPNKVVCPASVTKTIVTKSEFQLLQIGNSRRYILTEENGKITYQKR